MNPNSFSVSKLTDSDLSKLMEAVIVEMARRDEERKARRQEWVNDMYWRYVNHPNATCIHVGETTIVAVYDRRTGQRMATAVPVHGDVFDHDTGIAVAYAKAIGESVPDFI